MTTKQDIINSYVNKITVTCLNMINDLKPEIKVKPLEWRLYDNGQEKIIVSVNDKYVIRFLDDTARAEHLGVFIGALHKENPELLTSPEECAKRDCQKHHEQYILGQIEL